MLFFFFEESPGLLCLQVNVAISSPKVLNAAICLITSSSRAPFEYYSL